MLFVPHVTASNYVIKSQSLEFIQHRPFPAKISTFQGMISSWEVAFLSGTKHSIRVRHLAYLPKCHSNSDIRCFTNKMAPENQTVVEFANSTAGAVLTNFSRVFDPKHVCRTPVNVLLTGKATFVRKKRIS